MFRPINETLKGRLLELQAGVGSETFTLQTYSYKCISKNCLEKPITHDLNNGKNCGVCSRVQKFPA